MSVTGTSAGLIIGRVVASDNHPRGDRIWLAVIDFGGDHAQQVVYGGGRRVRRGDLVAYAPPGARLPSGVKMRRRHYRGEWSHGMLCSTTELGWDVDGPDEVAVLGPGIGGPGTSLDTVTDPERYLDEESKLSRKRCANLRT